MPHIHIISATGTALRRLVAKHTAELEASGFEVSRQEGGEWGELIAANAGGGLFGSRNAVVVESAERLGELPERYAPMLEGPDADNVLLLICGSKSADDDDSDGGDGSGEKKRSQLPVSKSLLAKCTHTKAPPAPSPWSRERDDIVIAAASKHGVKPSSDSVAMLKERFDDIDELEREAEKVASYCAASGEKKMTAEHVSVLCFADGERDAFNFVDRLCSGDATAVLSSMRLIADKISDAGFFMPFLSMLHNRMRLALYEASYGREATAITKALGARDYALRHARKAAAAYSGEGIERFMIDLFSIVAGSRAAEGSDRMDLSRGFETAVMDLLSAKR